MENSNKNGKTVFPEHSHPSFNEHCTCTRRKSDLLPPSASPNGDDSLWDLQFCRWWGWNWVRRREVEDRFGGREEDKQIKERRMERETTFGAKPDECNVKNKCYQNRRGQPQSTCVVKDNEDKKKTKRFCSSGRKEPETIFVVRCDKQKVTNKNCQTERRKPETTFFSADNQEKSCSDRRCKIDITYVAKGDEDEENKGCCPSRHRKATKEEKKMKRSCPYHGPMEMSESTSFEKNTKDKKKTETLIVRGNEDREMQSSCPYGCKKSETTLVARYTEDNKKNGCCPIRRKRADSPFAARSKQSKGTKKSCPCGGREAEGTTVARGKEPETTTGTKGNQGKVICYCSNGQKEPETKLVFRSDKEKKRWRQNQPRKADAMISEEDTQIKRCASSRRRKERSARRSPKGCQRDIQQIRKQSRDHLPTKKEFKDMCKCILGKKEHAICGMTSLFNTPSSSRVAMEGPSKCGHDVRRENIKEDKKKKKQDRKKTRRKQIEEDRSEDNECSGPSSQCSSKCLIDSEPDMTVSEEVMYEPPQKNKVSEPDMTVSEEVMYEPPQKNQVSETQRHFSSTDDSIEYLSVRLQHITDNMKCPCRGHMAPEVASKTGQAPQEGDKPSDVVQKTKNETETQTSFIPSLEDRETQTETKEIEKYRPPVRDVPSAAQYNDRMFSENIFSPDDKVFKIKSRKYKTICIRVCCCEACKPPNMKNGEVKDGAFLEEQELRQCATRNPNKPSKCQPILGSCKEPQTSTAYPFIVPLPNAKLFSKFGSPSKKYSWMQNRGSDGTSGTITSFGAYKSPTTGKIYDFSALDNDSSPKLTLPELIDITEDLSYLKKLENMTTSDTESRLLLDAVCDAILRERDDNSFEFYNENQLKDGVLKKDKDLEFLSDLQTGFRSRSDAYTDLSKSLLHYSHEDVGIQLSKTSNFGNIILDPSVTLSDMDNIMLSHLLENILADSNIDNTSKTSNAESYKFKGTDNHIFTKSGLLASRGSSFYKKPIKRGASSSVKTDNSNKKLRQEETSKERIREIDENNQISRKPSDRIGTIFSKVENILKQSKVKSAQFQKVFSFTAPQSEARNVGSERVLKTHSLGRNLGENSETDACTSKHDFENKKITEVDANSSQHEFGGKKATEVDSVFSKRSYRMSSDAFKGNICQCTTAKRGKMKKSYEFFSDRFGNDLNDFTKSCSEIIVEEKNNTSAEENNSNETKNEDAKTKSLEKSSKLSIHSFVVCDEKSTADQTLSSCGASEKIGEKSFKKICSTGSLIPIKKHSRSGGNLNNSL